MADPIINEQYNEFIGSRSIPGQTQTEYYNVENNQGFSNEAQLFNYATAVSGKPITSWADLAQPFRVDAPKEIPAATLEAPKSRYDLDQLLTENQKFRDQILANIIPTADETAAQNDLNSATNTLKNFDVSVEGGIQNIMKKPIALEFQQGQEAALTRDAAFTRSSLSRGVEARASVLQTLQQNRLNILSKLQAQEQFGQTDINTAIQLRQIQQQQQQAALKYRSDYGITTPFFNAGGTIYDPDNNPISTPAQFFAKAGVTSFDEARAKGLLSDASNLTVEQRLAQSNADRTYELQKQQLDSTKYQAITNPVTGEQMVFNPKTGQFTHVSGGSNDPSQTPFFGLGPKVYDAGAKAAANFDNEAVVKNFNVINEAKKFVDSLPNDTNNPADDQGLIYAFAKAMDPNSVVREGEYATVQKYSQSWLQSFGFNAQRVIDNNAFLTPDARAKLKATINSKYQASLGNYQNIYNQYAQRVDQAVGKKGYGKYFLTDYSQAYSNSDLEGLWNDIHGDGGSAVGAPGEGPPVDINAALKTGGLTLDDGGASKTSMRVPAGTSVALASAAVNKFPPGSIGGQCGDFVRSIANNFGLDYPRVGNSLTEKENVVKKYGVPLNQAGVGSVIVTSENKANGHVAWIIGKNSKGFIVAESNFAGKNKVSYGRVIPYNSKQIIGVINPKLKSNSKVA